MTVRQGRSFLHERQPQKHDIWHSTFLVSKLQCFCLIFCWRNEANSAAGCKSRPVDTALLTSLKGDWQNWFLYLASCICKGIDWKRENKCKGIWRETLKVGGGGRGVETDGEREMNGMKGRGNKMNILRERSYEVRATEELKTFNA